MTDRGSDTCSDQWEDLGYLWELNFVNDTVVLFVDNLEENLEMWDLTPDLEDIIKPLGRAEPPQTSTTRTFNNQDSVPHIHCHQKLQEKPGPVHLQTCSTNQHVLENSEPHRKSQDLKKRKLDPS